jgi:hypothetical protein
VLSHLTCCCCSPTSILDQKSLATPKPHFVGESDQRREILSVRCVPSFVRGLSGIRELERHCVSFQTPQALEQVEILVDCICYSWSLAPRWLGIIGKHPRLLITAKSLWGLRSSLPPKEERSFSKSVKSCWKFYILNFKIYKLIKHIFGTLNDFK